MARLHVFIITWLVHGCTSLEVPRWSDIFSSLEPYKDEATLRLEEEIGDPRLGFVQVRFFYLHREIWEPNLGPNLGPRFGTLIWDPNLGLQLGTPIWDPDLGPQFGL
jgi:hypothetical protein